MTQEKVLLSDINSGKNEKKSSMGNDIYIYALISIFFFFSGMHVHFLVVLSEDDRTCNCRPGNL